MKLIEERTIALAGVLQACSQVQALARDGAQNDAVADASLKSILVLDAVNTPAVYGGIDGVRTGLLMLKDGVLNSTKANEVEVLRYTMSLLLLQNQLYRDTAKFTEFANQIERLSAVDADGYIGACSEVYQSNVSVMRPQIIVQGEQGFLERADIPPKIRALLLAGFRSAVLWQQKGGGKFKLVWQRTRMSNIAEQLLASAVNH